ncbi:hypothetical protein [Alcanivorax sp. S71-1-4]|uniref:hypothetical protein n=1 Tax=Alcanivorax sp. S71-1-4 TaxID=1177159 RepID=UPI00135AC107|nr:hypothetical protein [Alcanivorax sp. S71-1-4]
MRVDIHWQNLDEGHEGWRQIRCLYAYLAPGQREILYIGKSWGATVRERWSRSGKAEFWDDLERQRGIYEHSALIGEVALDNDRRLTHQLLCDIESLLIHRVQPWGNIQSCSSRISRPGLSVVCMGDWPLNQRKYLDDV